MVISEHDIQNQIRLAIGDKQAAIIFRANVGECWTGKTVTQNGDRVVLKDARRFSIGLPKGFPDLFGLKTLKITPEMVGKKIAAFVFLEVKKKGGRTTERQEHIHKVLKDAGAIGGVVYSAEEALKILETGKS